MRVRGKGVGRLVRISPSVSPTSMSGVNHTFTSLKATCTVRSPPSSTHLGEPRGLCCGATKNRVGGQRHERGRGKLHAAFLLGARQPRLRAPLPRAHTPTRRELPLPTTHAMRDPTCTRGPSPRLHWLEGSAKMAARAPAPLTCAWTSMDEHGRALTSVDEH
jgi:hypothetical protein